MSDLCRVSVLQSCVDFFYNYQQFLERMQEDARTLAYNLQTKVCQSIFHQLTCKHLNARVLFL